MKKLGYIYKTVNKKNKKVYIGQHVGQFNPSYLGSGLHITRAVKKNGIHCFEVKILAYAGSKDKLDELEKLYIAEYRKKFPKQLYNIHDGGTGWPCGKSNPACDPKVRPKLHKALRVAMAKPEVREKIRASAKKRKGELNPRYGKHCSNITIQRISKALTGHPSLVANGKKKKSKSHKNSLAIAWIERRKRGFSEKTKLKMSKSHQGVSLSENHKQRISEGHARNKKG